MLILEIVRYLYSTNKYNPFIISIHTIKIGSVNKVVQNIKVYADPGPIPAARASWKQAAA